VEGTVSRVATRLVLEKYRPSNTVTICLPLFLAGGTEERAFATEHPTITVDGCEKLCAKIGTERHSGKVTSALVVTRLTGKTHQTPCSGRRWSDKDLNLSEKVAKQIAKEVDKILNSGGN
jgi:uncharacterized metal-binding protein